MTAPPPPRLFFSFWHISHSAPHAKDHWGSFGLTRGPDCTHTPTFQPPHLTTSSLPPTLFPFIHQQEGVRRLRGDGAEAGCGRATTTRMSWATHCPVLTDTHQVIPTGLSAGWIECPSRARHPRPCSSGDDEPPFSATPASLTSWPPPRGVRSATSLGSPNPPRALAGWGAVQPLVLKPAARLLRRGDLQQPLLSPERGPEGHALCFPGATRTLSATPEALLPQTGLPPGRHSPTPLLSPPQVSEIICPVGGGQEELLAPG